MGERRRFRAAPNFAPAGRSEPAGSARPPLGRGASGPLRGPRRVGGASRQRPPLEGKPSRKSGRNPAPTAGLLRFLPGWNERSAAEPTPRWATENAAGDRPAAGSAGRSGDRAPRVEHPDRSAARGGSRQRAVNDRRSREAVAEVGPEPRAHGRAPALPSRMEGAVGSGADAAAGGRGRDAGVIREDVSGGGSAPSRASEMAALVAPLETRPGGGRSARGPAGLHPVRVRARRGSRRRRTSPVDRRRHRLERNPSRDALERAGARPSRRSLDPSGFGARAGSGGRCHAGHRPRGVPSPGGPGPRRRAESPDPAAQSARTSSRR